MAPPSSAAARRSPAAPQQRPAARRPPLRIFQPEPRRGARQGRSARAHVWLAVGLVVASLLFVVVGDALVAQGQVRLSHLQGAIASAQATQKSMQSEVAQLAAPDRVVAQGIALGLTAPAQVVNLPQVPLDVPLPVPQTAPVATPAPAAAKASASPAPAASSSPKSPAATPAPAAPAATSPAR